MMRQVFVCAILLLVLVIIDLIFNDNRGFRRPP